jgi:hypothetical protein
VSQGSVRLVADSKAYDRPGARHGDLQYCPSHSGFHGALAESGVDPGRAMRCGMLVGPGPGPYGPKPQCLRPESDFAFTVPAAAELE